MGRGGQSPAGMPSLKSNRRNNRMRNLLTTGRDPNNHPLIHKIYGQASVTRIFTGEGCLSVIF